MEKSIKEKRKKRSRTCPAPVFPPRSSNPRGRPRARCRGPGPCLGTVAGPHPEEGAGRGPSVVASLRRGPRGGASRLPARSGAARSWGLGSGSPGWGVPRRPCVRAEPEEGAGRRKDLPRSSAAPAPRSRDPAAPVASASPFSRGPVRPEARGQRPGPISRPTLPELTCLPGVEGGGVCRPTPHRARSEPHGPHPAVLNLVY